MSQDDRETLEQFLDREWPHTFFRLQVTGQEINGKRVITIHRPGNEMHVFNAVVKGDQLQQHPEFRRRWWKRGNDEGDE